MAKPVILSAVVLQIVIGVSGLMWSACALRVPETSPEVIYVFPEGFRGVAKLHVNQPDGVSASPVNDVMTLSFPNSGELSIQGNLPDWYRPYARYTSGGIIPVFGADGKDLKTVPDNAIALRETGAPIDDVYYYVVGTYDDVVKFDNKRWILKPTPNN